MKRLGTVSWAIPLALAVGCSSDPSDDAGAEDVSVDVADASDVSADTTEDVGADATIEDVAEDVTADGSGAEDVEPDTTPEGLPEALAFEYTREPAGEVPTESEITEFTRALTGFWDESEYFRWVRMTSHGIDDSNENDWFSYAIWWQDVRAIRDGETITFQHHGRADNVTLRTCKVLNNAIAGYLLTGDEDMRWIVENYSRGLAAMGMVMEFQENDVEPYLQARAPFTRNHEFETVGGRQVRIDYDPVRRDEDAWNSAIIHNPTNPYWGDVHFVNQRSKDDIPHMMRSVPMLMRAVEEAPDESVRAAAALALEYLQGFSLHMTENNYEIMTKYADGVPVVPTREDGNIKDLASLSLFDRVLPQGECAAKLSVAYTASGETLGLECTTGMDEAFERAATTTHYFNYAIYRLFHVATAYLALMNNDNETALRMFDGLSDRADRWAAGEALPHSDTQEVWESDIAVVLVTMATVGLPLTGDEARFVQEQYGLSVDHYSEFELWDPWAEGIEDGTFDYMPQRGVAVRPTEIAHILEYCYSPLRNPASAEFVDCDVVADRARWGE